MSTVTPRRESSKHANTLCDCVRVGGTILPFEYVTCRLCNACRVALGTAQRIHAVLGNESCDLDSAVSALVYGYFLHQTRSPVTAAADRTDVIPVLNIPRAQFSLRTDIRHVFGQCGLNDDRLLTFRDDIDLELLRGSSRLQLTLVDFHMFPAKDTLLDGSVVEVIDHRPRARPDREKVPTTIELVGSCSTLIAEKLLAAKFKIPPEAIDMLFSAIMLDTVCLSDTAGRKTPKDDAIAAELERLRPSLDRRKIFDDLRHIKDSDVSQLTTIELLRRDLKVVSCDGLSIAITAVVNEMQEFLGRPNLFNDLPVFAAEQSSAAIVLMFLHVIPNTDDITRHLAVFSHHDGLRQQICDMLTKSTDPLLALEPVSLPGLHKNIRAFNQKNVKASRKAVLPIIRDILPILKLTLP